MQSEHQHLFTLLSEIGGVLLALGILGRFAGRLGFSPVPLYLLGFPPGLFAVMVPLVATYSLLQHSNLSWDYGPFRHVLASPAFHRWHHSSQRDALDKNYAPLFPFLDYLFGTAYFPRGLHSERYGLKGEAMPPNFWQHMIYPVRGVKGLRPDSRRSRLAPKGAGAVPAFARNLEIPPSPAEPSG